MHDRSKHIQLQPAHHRTASFKVFLLTFLYLYLLKSCLVYSQLFKFILATISCPFFVQTVNIFFEINILQKDKEKTMLGSVTSVPFTRRTCAISVLVFCYLKSTFRPRWLYILTNREMSYLLSYVKLSVTFVSFQKE